MKLYVCHLKTVVLFYLAQPREKGKEVIFMDFIDMPLLQMLMLVACPPTIRLFKRKEAL